MSAQRTWSQILRLLAAKITTPESSHSHPLGTTINKPIAGEIWHLSIEDLFAQPEILSLGGSGPFVINLSVSTAPISETSRVDRVAHGAQVYQIKVLEDGRMRYRLRLGPFTHEHEADLALRTVRDDYPGALTATAGPADLQIFESMQAAKEEPVVKLEIPVMELELEAEPQPQPRLQPQPELQLQPLTAASVPTAPVAPAPVAPAPASALAPTSTPLATLTPTPSPIRVAVKVTLPPPQPPVAPRTPAAAPSPRVVTPPAAPSVRPATPPPIKPREVPMPMVETTQTVRALTPTELNDRNASPSFVIQLLLATEPPDPEAVPNLDIFNEYRLYAVAGRDQGVVKHALRLGFFGDEAAAKMVASYLAAFYDNPLVVRVSGAEKDRFAERRVEARKDVGATGRHAAIEITGDLVARRRVTAPA